MIKPFTVIFVALPAFVFAQEWKLQTSGSPAALREVFFVNSSQWAVGGSGSIWKYVEETVSVAGVELRNYENLLNANFPNPTAQGTHIGYSLRKEAHVVLKIFDAMGREVGTLINEYQPPGLHTEVFDGGKFPNGIYYYQLTIDQLIEAKKMLLLR